MNKQSDKKTNHDIHSEYREFFPGDQVLVKDVRADETWWPSTVAERTAPKSYIVILEDGSIWKRHVDLIRKADYQITVASKLLLGTSRVRQHEDVTLSDPPFMLDITTTQDNQSDTVMPQSPMLATPDLPVETRRSTRQPKMPQRLIESI